MSASFNAWALLAGRVLLSHIFLLSGVMKILNWSATAAQSSRYFSSQAASRSSWRGPSLQVRTRPTFSVATSPTCSKTPTCFFMPVRVM